MINILIIDDTKSVHAFVKSFLSKSPEIKCHSVFDGKQAIELLQKQNNFDLILLDWEMPNLNGPDTFKEMKKSLYKIPTIMMTTKNKIEEISFMLDLGINEYMMKPFTIDVLFQKMESVLGKAIPYAA